MGFMTRKKHAERYRPHAWLAQKMPAQSVEVTQPAPVVVNATKKKATKKRRR